MQVCVSVMRASTIDRDWKLTKRTAREREKERASERERESGQRGKRRARQLTFSVLFCSYSSPFVRFPQVLSHDDSVCRFLKPSWLQMDDFSRCRNSVLCHLQECLFKTHTQTDTHATVSVILRFVVYVCARACVRVDPARRAAPSLLFVTLDWNAYSQSLHCWHSPADVTHPLIHNIVSATRRCVEAGGKRVRSPSKVRNGAWRIALFWLSSSNPSPSAFWTPSLPPLHTMLSPGPPSPLSWMQRENYD